MINNSKSVLSTKLLLFIAAAYGNNAVDCYFMES